MRTVARARRGVAGGTGSGCGGRTTPRRRSRLSVVAASLTHGTAAGPSSAAAGLSGDLGERHVSLAEGWLDTARRHVIVLGRHDVQSRHGRLELLRLSGWSMAVPSQLSVVLWPAWQV